MKRAAAWYRLPLFSTRTSWSPTTLRVSPARWNPDRGAVEAFEEQRFKGIVLARRSAPITPDDALKVVLLAIRASVLALLPWSDSTHGSWASRCAFRKWMPELVLPDVSAARLLDSIEQWLAPYLPGVHRLDALCAKMLT